MKKLSVALTILMLGTAALTGCSGKSDTLARDTQETQALWGLTFYETSAEEESETETTPETEENVTMTTTVTELENGVKLMAVDTIQIQSTASVNVRSGPGTDYDKVKGLTETGTVVDMTGICDNGWVQVEVDGSTGYISMDYVEAVEEEVSLDDLLEQVQNADSSDGSDNSDSSAVSEEDSNLVWATTTVNVREAADASAAILDKLNTGESAKLLERTSDDWWKIEVNGQEGYVSAQYLTDQQPEE